MPKALVRMTEKVIPADHRVFVLHPGFGYAFFQNFVERSAVYLDLPGFRAPRTWELEDRDVENRIRASVELARWYRSGGAEANRPSSDPNDFRRRSGRPSRVVSEAHTLYVSAKKGDLVIVPSKGYFSEIYVGEFSQDSDSVRTTLQQVPYRRDRIPARSVNWLHKFPRKIDLPSDVIRLTQNRQALIQIYGDAKRSIYDAAYKSYVVSIDDSSFYLGVQKERILLDDIGQISELTKFVISVFLALEAGRDDDLTEMDSQQIVERFFRRDVLVDTDVSIHSPGRLLIRTRNRLVSGFSAAVLTLTLGLAHADGEAPPKPDEVEIVGGEHENGEHEYDPDVVDYVNRMMRVFGEDKWRELIDKSKEAKENSGLTTAGTSEMLSDDGEEE